MKIFLDTANVDEINALIPYYPISGITTNPSILAKESNLKDCITKLQKLCGDEKALHIQTTASDAKEMFEQAKALKKTVGNNFYIKIPANEQGLKAVAMCKAAGIKTTVTAVFTPMQALTAALVGADYVAPYVDRLDNINANGVTVVKEILELLKAHDLKTQVLAASFKNLQQIYLVAALGVHAVTISPDLCKKLLFHPYTDKSLQDFERDWKNKFGKAQITDFIS